MLSAQLQSDLLLALMGAVAAAPLLVFAAESRPVRRMRERRAAQRIARRLEMRGSAEPGDFPRRHSAAEAAVEMSGGMARPSGTRAFAERA